MEITKITKAVKTVHEEMQKEAMTNLLELLLRSRTPNSLPQNNVNSSGIGIGGDD